MGLKIFLNKEEYFPGEKVQGFVQLDLEKTLKARKFEIQFDGFEHAAVTRGSGKSRHTYIEDHNFAYDVKELWQPASEPCIGPCHEQVPFEFTVPLGALPSLYTPFSYPLPPEAISKGINKTINIYAYTGTINYQLKAKLDEPFAIDLKDKIFFRVPSVPLKRDQPKSTTQEAGTSSGKTHMLVTVNKDIFSPGDLIQGYLRLQKAIDVKARNLIISLRYIYSYTAQGNTDFFVQDVDRLIFADIQDQDDINTEFRFVIPISGPYTILGKIVKMTWEVDAKLDLPWKKDIHVRVPVIVTPVMSENVEAMLVTSHLNLESYGKIANSDVDFDVDHVGSDLDIANTDVDFDAAPVGSEVHVDNSDVDFDFDRTNSRSTYYCPNCGAEYSPNTGISFCPHCGEDLRSETEPKS